jgi:hypothetical protein
MPDWKVGMCRCRDHKDAKNETEMIQMKQNQCERKRKHERGYGYALATDPLSSHSDGNVVTNANSEDSVRFRYYLPSRKQTRSINPSNTVEGTGSTQPREQNSGATW